MIKICGCVCFATSVISKRCGMAIAFSFLPFVADRTRCAAPAGMSAGVQDYVTINLSTLASAFGADEVVTIGALQEKRILNLSGREAKLPLKVRTRAQTIMRSDLTH